MRACAVVDNALCCAKVLCTELNTWYDISGSFVNDATGKLANLEPTTHLSVFCFAIDAHHCRGMWVWSRYRAQNLYPIMTCDVPPPGAVSIAFAFVMPENGAVELRLATGDFRATPAYINDCDGVLKSAKETWPQWFSQDPFFSGT